MSLLAMLKIHSNFDGRFSLSEATPSRTSGPENPKNSNASDASKVGPAKRNQLLSAYLVHLIALCEPLLNFSATSNALPTNPLSSTSNDTKPMRSAAPLHR